MDQGKWRKRLRQISFSKKDIDPLHCVLTFKKVAKSFEEDLPYESTEVFDNGVYTYFNRFYEGDVTVLDMNSAYLYALCQPLADFETRTEVTHDDVYKYDFDYYSFENSVQRIMFYKYDKRILGAMLWSDTKIYGYKASCHYVKTCKELFRLKMEVDKEKYKNVANIAVGCMHKHNGKQNNATLAASLYAWFAWYVDNLVDKFKNKGYNVIMVTTDSIKIAGNYNENDQLVTIGEGLGEFKYEYIGPAKYFSEGHYEESSIKWKGKPQYLIDGFNICNFIDNIDEELEIYEKYAIT